MATKSTKARITSTPAVPFVSNGTAMGDQSATWATDAATTPTPTDVIKAAIVHAAIVAKAKPARTCRFGEGAYGSPEESKRCGKPIHELDKHPGHMLCIKHVPVWNAIAKARAAAKAPATVAKSKSAGTSPKSTPKPKARVAKAGPVTKVPKSLPMLPPIARVVNAQPGAMMVQFLTSDPDEGKDK